MELKKFLSNWMTCWVGASLFTWYLYSKMQTQELVASALIGAAAAIFLHYLSANGQLSFHLRWRWAGPILLRAPWQLMRGINGLVVVLWRSLASGIRPTGSFHECRYTSNRNAGPGEPAIALGAVSLPPTSFSVSLRVGNLLLFHQLSASATSPMEEWGL